MHPNTLVKSTLHAFSALLTLGYTVYILLHNDLAGIAYLVPGLMMAVLAFAHERIWVRQSLKTVLFFLFESISLAAIAWRLYQFHWHKATFFYEGVSIFFFSLAAFTFLLRKKSQVLFREEELK